MVNAGGLLPLAHSRQAEVAIISGDGHILDGDLFLPPVGPFHHADSPFIRFEVMLLLAGQLTGMAATAPLVIDV
jgi:hypothetical protein